MAIEKLKNGRWLVDVEPLKGKRFRKRCGSKAEALRYEADVRARYTSTADVWGKRAVDKRNLSELIDLWYGHHGLYLSDPDRRKRSLDRLCEAVGDPVAKKFSPAMYLDYRKKRTLAGVLPKTLNNELGYVKALYNYLWQTEQIRYQCPIAKVKPVRIKERELAFLTLSECQELLSVIRQSGNCCLYLIVRVCLETGARWSESEKLTLSQIGRSRLTYTDTKSGRNRTVPITDELESDLRGHCCGTDGLFATSITAFRRLLKKCKFKLPRGQASHALRHTYASHYMMNGGDILTLQKLLGHSTIALTMRYAHLSPGHMAEAVQYRPKLFFDTFSTHQPSDSKNP